MGRKRRHRNRNRKANSMKIKTKACSVKLQRLTVANVVIVKEEPHNERNDNIAECLTVANVVMVKEEPHNERNDNISELQCFSSLINAVIKEEHFPDEGDCIMEEPLTVKHAVKEDDDDERYEYNEEDKQIVEPQHTMDEVNNMGEYNCGQYTIQTKEYSSVHHKFPSASQTSRKMGLWHRHYPRVYNHLWHNNNKRYPPVYNHLWHNNNRCYPLVYNHQLCTNLYQCDICGQEFYEFSMLLRHKLVHNCLDILRDALNTLKVHRCNICGIDVVETDALIKHKWDHLQQYVKAGSWTTQG